MVLSLFPRNKILMQFIGETYGKLCDGLYFILDDSETHYFNQTLIVNGIIKIEVDYHQNYIQRMKK